MESKLYPKRNSISDLDNALSDKLLKIKDEIIADIKKYVDGALNELTATLLTHVEHVENQVECEKETTKKLIDKVSKLEETCNQLKNENMKMKKNWKEDIASLEDKIEDQTNRQLRKTLIFTNLSEVEGEDDDRYKKTTEILANKISEVSKGNISKEKALDAIERAHTGRPKRYRNCPKPVYAAITDWRVSEQIKQYFLSKNNSSGVYCDQMYGTMTTWRRQQALKKRKELKANGEIVKGYISFPAKLMVLKPGRKEYSLHEDFSKMEVTFDKKMSN